MIVFATTCKGRTEHISQTLPANLRDNPRSRFVVLNYNDKDGLVAYLKANHQKDIERGQLVVYMHPAPGAFHVSHAKNMAARLAAREGANILVTLDADNYAGKGFEDFIEAKFTEPGIFLCPDHFTIKNLPHGPERPQRGYAGRLAVRTQDFIKAGAYNETYDTWRGEDIDFNVRMQRMGYHMRFIDNRYLETIPHNAKVRFREYPHARQHESGNEWKIADQRTDTIVNWGKFGCGTAYRNFGNEPVELDPIPTRIFGIGLHKTATTSLHRAFSILGFDSLHWGKGEAPAIWYEMAEHGRSKTLERFYAACDLPIPLLYKQLDKSYPGSKFVLTVRDEAKWLESVRKMWDREYNATRRLWEIYPISHTLHRELYGRIDFDPETMLCTYRRHNAEVIEYFKGRNDLKVMHMPSDGWNSLCSFIGIDFPSVPYPNEYITRRLMPSDEHPGSC
jgi:Sulfotransferase domain/N-terminal domain of galactosyltransferase